MAKDAEALAANERLYLGPDYPDGHPDLANAYNNMGYAHAQLRIPIAQGALNGGLEINRIARRRRKILCATRRTHLARRS